LATSIEKIAGRLFALSKERCERELYSFIKESWPVLEPATEFRGDWHIGYVCEHLQAVTADEITGLIVNMPSRITKNYKYTIAWPVWERATMPWTRWLFGSYGASLSTEHSLDRRNLVATEWYA
jgi:hypothetical protein